MYKTKSILFFISVFIMIGLLTVFFTHKAAPSDNVMSQAKYIESIEPWIDSAYLDQSPSNILSIKNNFLNFHSDNRAIGPTHIALFLAFDSWEKFLSSGDEDSKEQAIEHFYTAAELLPELNLKIEDLVKILKEQNV